MYYHSKTLYEWDVLSRDEWRFQALQACSKLQTKSSEPLAAMEKGKTATVDSLKIGDYVTFRSVKFEGLLSAEGILRPDLVLQETLNYFDDAIFCVHLARQYSASRELEEFLENNDVDIHNVTDENTQKYLHALQRGQQNETRLNDNYMKQKIGQPVNFGDNIQLYHVKSGKYLQIIPHELASTERENLLASLTANGSIYSWLQISPRFKIDREGDPILSNNEVYLRIAERPSEYIHCAERDPFPGSFREVNCSLEPSSWKMTIFQSSVDSVDPSILLAQEIVRISDPEIQCELSIDIPPLDGVDSLSEDSIISKSTSFDMTKAIRSKECVNDNDDEQESHHEEHHDGLLTPRDRGYDVILKPSLLTHIDSNSLWYLESSTLIQGGPIMFKNEFVRFKHINTGLYIKQTYRFIPIENTDEEIEQFYFSTTFDSSDESTLFSLNELNATTKTLSNNRAQQIGRNGVWMTRGVIAEGSAVQVVGTKDKSAAGNLMITRYVENKSSEETTVESSIREPIDIYSGLNSRNYFRRYLDMTEIPTSDTVGTIWPYADRSDMKFFDSLVNQVVFFSQGFPISSTNIQLGVDKADGNLRMRRQHLLREQGLLELLLRVINKLISITKRSEQIASMRAKQASSISEDEQAMLTMGHLVLNKCFHLLFYSIQDHPENQMYIADFMPVLLSHLGNNQPLASKCVTEMLSNNMELQETKIGTREIAIFVDKLRASKMGAMYLNLLQSCCSCQGSGVDNNQCKVAEMLFSDTNDIIIQVHADYNRSFKMDWNISDSLYISANPVPGSPIHGINLVTKGLPTLSLSWTTKSIDFSPLGLFGKLSVRIDELYRVFASTRVDEWASGGKKPAPKKVSGDQKNAVANYFVAEMYLGAEMCLDRNYVAMHLMDTLFSYEVLVAMMKMEVDTKLKSAAVRLLMCLYVDRDPQAETKVPCFTRTWSEVQKNPVPKLPFVEPGRRNYFALIQQLISEHIRDMAGRRWDEYSNHMLRMLRSLVVFNFYGDFDRLNDVIGPLIQALDRRKVDFAEVDIGSLSRSKSKKSKSNVSSNQWAEDGISKDEESKSQDVIDASGSMENINEKDVWQKRLLDFLESIPVLIGVLGLVFIAVGMTVYQNITGVPDGPGTVLFDVGMVILAIFIVEVTSRGYCYFVVYRELWSFVTNGFNQIDISVILLDIFFLGMPSTGGSGYTKIVRLVRLLRLLRILRAARVVSKLSDMLVTSDGTWKPPIRYTKAPLYELETMVEAVNVLAYCQEVIADRNISLLLRHFMAWESGDDKRSPKEIFENIIEDAKQLSLGISNFDNVMIDVLMFVHTPLVQGGLELIMAHHSLRQTLLNNAKEVQLLVSHKRERQYKLVDQMLQQLERNAETHELWGELESEADLAVNKQTKDIIKELTDVLRIRRFHLEFDEEYTTDVEMQNLFRNLGCFNIAMKVLGLLDSVDPDENGEYGEVALNTRELCLLCNDLMYWFLLCNSKNQDLGYEELDFFLDSLDASINSHLVIRAMFKDNEVLMKRVPHSHLLDLAERICKDGKSHHYLSLFAAITYVGDKNIPKNQFEIAKILASQARLPKIQSFLVPIDHPDYSEKQQLMAPYMSTRNLKIDDLPTELAYHLALLEVFSGCTMGRLNITTVEAKIQSIYNPSDIIQAIMDPHTMLLAKIKLLLYLLNAFIEVEMKIPAFEQTESIWALLRKLYFDLEPAAEDFKSLDRLGWESPLINRQKYECYIVCIMLIGSFYARYYDGSVFRHDEHSPVHPGKVAFTTQEVGDFTRKVYHRIKEIYFVNSNRLTMAQKQLMYEAMRALHSTNVVTESLPMQLANEDEAEAVLEQNLETKVLTKYKDFLSMLESDDDIKKDTNNETMEFIAVMESLPYLSDPQPADIRYETFIKKLVSHIRENFKIINNERRLDPRCTKTTIWIIKAFRTMIENRMGMSIYERDEEGGEEQDIAAEPVVTALNTCGATTLCLDLIAVGIDDELQNEAIKLCVAMLFKEGGALEVQETMFNYLSKNPTELFFKQARLTLQKLIAWHKWHGVIELAEDKEPELPDDIIIVRFLQLLSEGHYLKNQDIMREQPNNHGSVNLLDDFVQYLNTLSRIPCRTSTTACGGVAATILEVIQGPCTGNQVHFALNTELIETLNRVLRAQVVRDCIAEEELDLKKTSIKILQGLLEGQGAKSVVYERVLSVIHMDLIQVMTKQPEPGQEFSDDEAELQTQATVLLQMFCDFKPTLRGELGISTNVEDIVDSDTACIEVMWRGELHRRFFHMPHICYDLAKTTKDYFVENVDRSNLENKLVSFLESAHEMYREVKHQQVLKEKKLSKIFNPKNQHLATWFSFVLSCVINLLMVTWYSAKDGSPGLPADKELIINILNIILIAVSTFTLVLYFVVRTPVIYQSLESMGHTQSEAILYSACDPMCIYYLWYLIFAILGLAVKDDFLPFLLLDIIVKNSTTRDVLNAVIVPRKQIAMGSVVILFVIFIFAFFVFMFFRHKVMGTNLCYNLYDCTKMTLTYGLRGGTGVGDFMDITLGTRYMLDIAFFIAITLGMLNLIAGVIITTFGQLREEKEERMIDTTEKCFVCGIDKQTFDRASKEPEGFKRHIKIDHNMWNYLFFIFHLWEQDKDDDDGMEQFVRRAIDRNDISWFPMNKAMCLDQDTNEEEAMRSRLKGRIAEAEMTIASSVNMLQSDVVVVLEQLVQAINKDNNDDSSSMASFQVGELNMMGSENNLLDALESIDHLAGSSHNGELSLVSQIALGRPVCLGLVDLRSAALDNLTDLYVACTIVAACGNYTIRANAPVRDGKVTFGMEDLFLIAEDAMPDDVRICRCQFLTYASEEDAEIGNNAKLFAAVDIGIDELIASEGTMIKHLFSRPGHPEPNCLRLISTSAM